MNQRQRVQMFRSYLQQRFELADAMTPGQKLEVIEQLRKEARGEVEGHPNALRMPKEGGGTILLPTNHDLVQAALDGRRVSMGGTTIEAQQSAASLSERMEALPTAAKLGVLAAIFILPLLLLCALMNLMGGEEEPALAMEITPTLEPTLTVTALLTPTLTIEPIIAATQVVTVTAPLPSPTPYAIALGTLGGEAGSSGNDPASIEVAGYTWVLAAGSVANGQWLPVGAEWLAGTQLRRVVAVPYEPDVATTISELRGGEVIRLRLRSGEIAKYKVSEVRRQQRQQIEVLAERTPSLVLLLHSEPSAERWVVLAEAVQQPQEFTVYTAGVDSSAPAPVVPTAALPTLVPGAVPGDDPSLSQPTEIVTDSRTIRSEATGLELTIKRCQTAEQIGEEEPPSKQAFLICDVTLTALAGHVSVPFSAEALAITEQDWITSNIDWWPPSVGVTRALSSGGTLSAGRSTQGRIAGLVARVGSFLGSSGQPVVVWEQAGRRYLIQVAADAP